MRQLKTLPPAAAEHLDGYMGTNLLEARTPMENRPGRSRGENDFHNFGNVEVKKISIIVFFF